MRLVAALDSATEVCAVGLGALPEGPAAEGVELVAEGSLAAPRAAMSVMLPRLRELLGRSGHNIADIACVVVGRGPGSFTGVRIGVATAKGLAQGLRVPLAGVRTLDAIAMRFSAHEGLLGVVGDAMRGEVYPALYRCSDGRVERLTPDVVARPEAIAAEWADGWDAPVLLAGNALRKHLPVFVTGLGVRAEVADESLWCPTGDALLRAAWHAEDNVLRAVARREDSAGEGPGDPNAVLPVYTRLSDAEEAERAHGTAEQAGGVR